MDVFHSRFALLLFALAIASHGPTSANAEEPIAITTLFDCVATMHCNIESLRIEMGKPRIPRLKLTVTNASHREVYFQGLVLYSLADRLCFEILGESQSIDTVNPDHTIDASDVWMVVDAAAARIRDVRQHLDVTDHLVIEQRIPKDDLDDLFLRINQECRQLNILLDHHFTPADVYQQLTTAVAYTSLLRAEFPGRRIPDEPEYERGKTPREVYSQVLECYRNVQKVAAHLDLETTSLSVASEDFDNVRPSDVYDLTSLLVAELSYLHYRSDNALPVRKSYYPGRKFPSHVYQRARLLDEQLLELNALMHQ